MTAGAVWVLAGALIGAPVLAAAHRYGPPPAHTGGFGEKTCHECHFDNDINEAGGTLRVRGLPKSWEAGITYDIEILLARADLELGGFQAALRVAAGPRRGAPAGVLDTAGPGLAAIDTLGMRYVQHTIEATKPSTRDTMRWRLRWTAPAGNSGEVVLNVAANAGNGDDSPFGDHIYTLEVRVPQISPQPRSRPVPLRAPETHARASPRSRL